MVWLNIDLGELPNEDAELYQLADIANVACGGHVGDRASVEHALSACVQHDTIVCAHPSYPDREGFGRRSMQLEPHTLEASLVAQCRLLRGLCREMGLLVPYVKAHGALYHDIGRDPRIATIFVRAMNASFDRPWTLLSMSPPAVGEIQWVREGFADRAVYPDGTLVSRSEPGSVLHTIAEVRDRTMALLQDPEVTTVCLHGDNPQAVVLGRLVREMLDARK